MTEAALSPHRGTVSVSQSRELARHASCNALLMAEDAGATRAQSGDRGSQALDLTWPRRGPGRQGDTWAQGWLPRWWSRAADADGAHGPKQHRRAVHLVPRPSAEWWNGGWSLSAGHHADITSSQ